MLKIRRYSRKDRFLGDTLSGKQFVQNSERVVDFAKLLLFNHMKLNMYAKIIYRVCILSSIIFDGWKRFVK